MIPTTVCSNTKDIDDLANRMSREIIVRRWVGGAGPRAQRRRLITGSKGSLSFSSRASLQLRLDENSMTRAKFSYK